MRLAFLWSLTLLSTCTSQLLLYNHLTITAETIPVWEEDCIQKLQNSALPRAVSLVLRRDPILNQPEWVSGHRMALTAACETFYPRILILETPEEDSAFYPARTDEQVAWQNTLREWVFYELLPFVSTYPSIRKIFWGRGFARLPLPDSFWVSLIAEARRSGPAVEWGMIYELSDRLPALGLWQNTGLYAVPRQASLPHFHLPADKPLVYLDYVHSDFPSQPMTGFVVYSPSPVPRICYENWGE